MTPTGSTVGAVLTVDGPKDGVATITITRAEKRNALSIALRDAMGEAFALGLVNRVVDDGVVVETAQAVAAEIASAPRDVLLQMVQKIRRRAGIAPGATLDL